MRLIRRWFWVLLGGVLLLLLSSTLYFSSGASSENPIMHVSFERSGGFAGIPVTLEMDAAALSTDEAAQLHQLVEAADFFHLPKTIPAPAQPDRFQYTITIQEGKRHHTVTVAETAVPTTLKPLLTWLMDAARKR